MLTTMRKVRLWTLGLCVLSIGAAAAFGARAAGRVLTSQDVVTIKVVNQPDMDTTTRVETDGTISFPYVGRIRAAGLSEDDLARAIERRLAARQIVTDPHVLVEISTSAPRRASKARLARLGVVYPRPPNEPDPTVVSSRRTEGCGHRRNDHREPGPRRDRQQLRLKGRAGRPRTRRDVCRSPTTMRFLWTWRLLLLYGYVGRSRRILFDSTPDSAGSYFDRRRTGHARVGLADQDQAQGGEWRDDGSPGVARRPGAGG